jgi:hypothetical protein
MLGILEKKSCRIRIRNQQKSTIRIRKKIIPDPQFRISSLLCTVPYHLSTYFESPRFLKSNY